jgi:hypothetical protein
MKSTLNDSKFNESRAISGGQSGSDLEKKLKELERKMVKLRNEN